MSGTLAPLPFLTCFDSNGDPISGALLYSYVSGTTTPSALYADAGLTTPLPNPAVADSAGRLVAYLDPTVGSYKLQWKTPAGVAVGPTVDPVQAVSSSNVLGTIWDFGGDPNSPITLAAYPSGAGTDKIHKGTVLFNLNSQVLAAGTYKLEGMLVSVSGATLTAAIVNLTDGSPDTALASITSASTTPSRQQSAGITFAVPGAAKDYAVKVKSSAASGGFVWGLKLVRTA